MKRRFTSMLAVCICSFISINSFAQGLYPTSWDDVIAEDKGDIVVVKGYYETSWFNTLLWAVKADTNPDGSRTNPNRIYETIPGEYYISDATLELDTRVPLLHITAPEPPPGVMPPVHVRAKPAEGLFDKTFFLVYGDTYMENQYFLHVTINDTYEEREFMRTHAVGTQHEYHNCIWEMTAWAHHVPQVIGQSYKFFDCKFLNVGHEATIEKGCVLETRNVNPDTVWFENCTFLNGGIFVMGLDATGPMHAYFNHNTIVNCLQPPFSFYTEAEMIVTNNLFVNAGMVSDYPTFYSTFGDDDDNMEQGIINIDTMEQVWISQWFMDENREPFYPFMIDSVTVDEAQRKVLFEKNSLWWDARLLEMANTTLPAEKPIGPEIGDYEWASQMKFMNDRTQAMFDDDEAYPYLNEGENLEIEPDFANNKDMIPEWISFTISNSTPGIPNGGDLMPQWRTNTTSNLWQPDWPMLADLSYTKTELINGGVDGYPLGDLNWFPSEKDSWKATKESKKLWQAMKWGTPTSEDWSIETDEMQNIQFLVYPNPFTNTANVQFKLTSGANVELYVYNLLGQKVMSLDLGYRINGTHNVTLDKDNLNPGMYILQIDAENMDQVSTRITIN